MIITARERNERLESIRRNYRVLGQHPYLYAVQDWATFLGRHRRLRRRAVEAMQVCSGARVLEVACGTGRNFPYVQASIGSAGELVGFDYSLQMLESARQLVDRNGWQNVRLIQGDAAVLDVGDAPFDGVLCALAMTVIPDHMQTLRRCWEVLRPGAILSVCEAQPLQGRFEFLDPLGWLYRRFGDWNPDRDILKDMSQTFGNVHVQYFNAGSIFIATSRKEPGALRSYESRKGADQ